MMSSMWWSILCVKMIDTQETQIFGQTLLSVCLLVYFLDEINIWIIIWIKQTTLPSVDKPYPVSWMSESHKKADALGVRRNSSCLTVFELGYQFIFTCPQTQTWIRITPTFPCVSSLPTVDLGTCQPPKSSEPILTINLFLHAFTSFSFFNLLK